MELELKNSNVAEVIKSWTSPSTKSMGSTPHTILIVRN